MSSNSDINAERWTATDASMSQPMRWRKRRHAEVARDLFHEAVPFDFIDRVFAVMALCPQHTFQVLTKRPERMAEYLTADAHRDNTIWWHAAKLKYPGIRGITTDTVVNLPLPNVWLGTSVENQQTADERIPHLLKCPAAVRFLSCEPLLGPVDLFPKCPPEFQPWLRSDRISWVIVGGESGHGARPCNIEWIRSIAQQCKAAGVSVFVKRLGAIVHTSTEDSGWGKNWNPLYPRDEIRKTTLLGYQVELRDPKGGDISEFPPDLRVREFPVIQEQP